MRKAALREQTDRAQVIEILWRHSQFTNRYSSMMLFSELIAEELNEFFGREE